MDAPDRGHQCRKALAPRRSSTHGLHPSDGCDRALRRAANRPGRRLNPGAPQRRKQGARRLPDDGEIAEIRLRYVSAASRRRLHSNARAMLCKQEQVPSDDDRPQQLASSKGQRSTAVPSESTSPYSAARVVKCEL
ncbi:hypothetical protein NX02_p0170 (plasmid) [Sphingomonas sanxanigenens DSM 19645 = NX02]|uniref:Uncharacterized protein n=1 Tax=Sphingomonas sanxanigenens DSM 19645 = NX02 TaxID=1123269 RepID=A0A0F7JV57_9SPHN|nr:hypothetical protein NX02_p0170 [Sphingomonas sanxanigenens DSM 19645 = NX02]